MAGLSTSPAAKAAFWRARNERRSPNLVRAIVIYLQRFQPLCQCCPSSCPWDPLPSRCAASGFQGKAQIPRKEGQRVRLVSGGGGGYTSLSTNLEKKEQKLLCGSFSSFTSEVRWSSRWNTLGACPVRKDGGHPAF